ncbi:hypothetical protein MOQ_006059 [Trypanosoma cruzi marinkellei]|uniref:DUF1935 domain-containing protein n=1 Tax=Trypanosoma cruzi marinkellei TaxID=85056 RepID=K2N698_TRYCR|nr:hypothetical protein MOQ_006059 [Trypanosoma cruzi marinkellei]
MMGELGGKTAPQLVLRTALEKDHHDIRRLTERIDEDWQKAEINSWPVFIQKGVATPNRSEGSCSMTSVSGESKDVRISSSCSGDPSSVERDPRAGQIHQRWRCRHAAVTERRQPPLFLGPGPSTNVRYDKIFCCFNEGNGLLFRLVDEIHHTWAYYNDTMEYTMHITVTFGRESRVEAIGKAECIIMDAASGICSIDLLLPPGGTELFMCGEYNGFCGHYETVSSRGFATGERRK